jgi:hypothetical protein
MMGYVKEVREKRRAIVATADAIKMEYVSRSEGRTRSIALRTATVAIRTAIMERPVSLVPRTAGIAQRNVAIAFANRWEERIASHVRIAWNRVWDAHRLVCMYVQGTAILMDIVLRRADAIDATV